MKKLVIGGGLLIVVASLCAIFGTSILWVFAITAFVLVVMVTTLILFAMRIVPMVPRVIRWWLDRNKQKKTEEGPKKEETKSEPTKPEATAPSSAKNKNSSPMAQGIAFAIGCWAVTVLGALGVLAYINGGFNNGLLLSNKPATATEVVERVPAKLALAIICKHESGCKQFENDGKTPFKNREGSTAFGKYQFLESHREPAAKLGFDLNTEVGQDAYARHLFEEGLRKGESPTKHWEGDPKGSWRWQTELMSLGYGPWHVVEGVVVAKPNEESFSVILHKGIYVEWSTDGGAIEIKNQLGKTAKFDPSKGVVENLPYPSTEIRFRSLGDKEVEVKIRFSKTPLVDMTKAASSRASPLVFYIFTNYRKRMCNQCQMFLQQLLKYRKQKT